MHICTIFVSRARQQLLSNRKHLTYLPLKFGILFYINFFAMFKKIVLLVLFTSWKDLEKGLVMFGCRL